MRRWLSRSSVSSLAISRAVRSDAEGAADLVVERDGAVVEQRAAGVVLVVDDLGDHQVLEVADDVVLGLAERGLVADLVEVAGRFGAFAVEPADGEAHVLGGAEDLFDLAGELQGRQVEHHADADAGADVGRAGGQVAEAGVEAEVELGSRAGRRSR